MGRWMHARHGAGPAVALIMGATLGIACGREAADDGGDVARAGIGDTARGRAVADDAAADAGRARPQDVTAGADAADADAHDSGGSWQPMPPAWALHDGPLTVRVTAEPPGWRVERDGALVVASAGPAWRVAVPASGAVPDDAFYDPTGPMWPIAWYAAAKIAAVRPLGDASVELRVQFEPSDGDAGAPMELLVAVGVAADTVLIDLDADDSGAVLCEATLVVADADEEFYGLGETYDSVAQRGYIRPMFMALGTLESGTNEAHVPVPFLVSTSGWGVFVPSRRAGAFDVAASDPDVVAVRFEAPALPLRVFARRNPIEAIEDYAATTGLPALPPRWAFAPHWWHNEWKDAEELLAGAQALRELHIPTGVVWIDNPWQQHYNDHRFDPAKFPDPGSMMATLSALGFRVIAWSTPYVEDSLQPVHDDLLAAGGFVDAGGSPPNVFGFGDLVDLTSPVGRAQFGALVAHATDAGIVGFKLDYGEEIVPGILGARIGWHFGNGETEATQHSAFQIAYHSLYAEVLEAAGVDGFLLVRGGTWGDQAISTTVWPGDLCSGFQVPGEGSGHVGGLPAAVAAGLSLSASGYPFYASDIGGFRHGRPTERVLLRWAAAAAVAPVMQLGGGGANHDPFDFAAYPAAPEHGDGEADLVSQYGPATVDAYRRFARLHTALFPWLYTLSVRASQTGTPVTVPFGLAFPQTGWHPSDVYVVDGALLVAPEVHGEDARDVPLPPGRWVDWWTGQAHDGPAVVTRDVPLDEVPLYVRAGALVPMLAEVPDTLAPVEGEGAITALPAGASWRAAVRVAPPADAGEHAEVSVYDGSTFRVTRAGEAVALEVSPGDEVDAVTWDVLWRAAWPSLERVPKGVELDGEALPEVEPDTSCAAACWSWAPDEARVSVRLPAGVFGTVTVLAQTPPRGR